MESESARRSSLGCWNWSPPCPLLVRGCLPWREEVPPSKTHVKEGSAVIVEQDGSGEMLHSTTTLLDCVQDTHAR